MLMLDTIKIVMVNTTLPANIGSALRAMKTMGLKQLVLVAPKSFPHPDINALAAGAEDLIPNIQVVSQLHEAIEDCHLVFATSARQRHLSWPLIAAKEAAEIAIKNIQTNHKVAIIFGREDRGLTNEELALANYHLTIPVNPEYGVLNVAQAIQIVCYELRVNALLQHNSPTMSQTDYWDEPLVTQEKMQQFYPHLEEMLQTLEFFDPQEPRLLPLRLRRLFGRIQLDQAEYNLLRGIFSRVQALSQGKWKKSSIEESDNV